MTEEAIIRKLVADGDGTGDDRRILHLFQLINSLGKSSDSKSVTNKIVILLDQIEFSFRKQQQIAQAMNCERENYEKLYEEIGNLLNKNQEKMEEVKKQLAEAKQVKKNQQEYDNIAKMIKEKPSRAETTKKLKILQDELEEAYSKQKILEQKLIEKRESISTLAALLDELDETNKEQVEDVLMAEVEEGPVAPPTNNKPNTNGEKVRNELEM
uniref:THO complex subunit 7 n=1 Tax=Meloidogyne incognita TaxID=6306 RepID=A0A914L8S0_MELIC